MTVTLRQMLQRPAGTHQRLFAKIDGLEPILWEQEPHHDHVTGESDFEPPGGGHPVTYDCMGLWRLDELIAGANAADATQHNHTGTQTGSPPVVAGKIVVSGTASGARSFASGDYFSIANSSKLQPQRLTIAGWVYPLNASQNNNATIYVQINTGGGGRAIWMKCGTGGAADPGAYLQFDDAGTAYVLGNTLSINTWYHLAMTWDGSTLSWYQDGALVGTDTPSGGSSTINYGTQVACIGNQSTGPTNFWWNGRIDDLAFYNTCKSAEWIRMAYQAGGWTRWGLNCLLPPGDEISQGLDLGRMTVNPSAINLELRNIPDPSAPTTSYFAKLFAPGAWAQTTHTVLARLDSDDRYLDADASTIYAQDLTDFDSAGTAYIGQETFTYTGKSTDTTTGATVFAGQTIGKFTGVVKGCFPALTSTNFGRTYAYPKQTAFSTADVGDHAVISTKPYSWLGRRVGLYLTAWDPETRRWFPEASAELVWAGKLIDEVRYDPVSDSWLLPCQNILEALDRPILSDSPNVYGWGINLNGGDGTTCSSFDIFCYNTNATTGSIDCVAYAEIDVPATYYSLPSLCKAITKELQDGTNWTDRVASQEPEIGISIQNKGAQVSVVIADSTYAPGRFYTISTNPYRNHGAPCHAMQALGMPSGQFVTTPTDDNGKASDDFPNEGFYHYHPMHVKHNGGVLRALWKGNDEPWSDQGDGGTGAFKARAYLMAREGVHASGLGDKERTAYVTCFRSLSAATDVTAGHEFALYGEPFEHNEFGFVGSSGIYDPIVYKQVYIPRTETDESGSIKTRGPLAALLYPLLSTGTASYNDSTYDQMPLPLSLGIPIDIVDTASFLRADALLLAKVPGLCNRMQHVIEDPVKWLSDLFAREAMLFGLFLSFDSGAITCKAAYDHDTHLQSDVIYESDWADEAKYPSVSSSIGTVINQRTVDLNYDLSLKKYLTSITIKDQQSIHGLDTIKEVTLQHPGLTGERSRIQGLLIDLFEEFQLGSRFPWQTVDVSLGSHWVNRLAVGGVVQYVATYKHPDPYGTGVMQCTAYAIALDSGWNYQMHRGRARLLLYAQTLPANPWACAAATDIDAANGGWDATNYRLTLLPHEFGNSATDAEDGVAFNPTDEILIIERAPETPGSALSWSATVASAYETDGANLLTLDTVTLTGWQSDREYIIVPANYTDATSGQKLLNIWAAQTSDYKMSDGDSPFRWG